MKTFTSEGGMASRVPTAAVSESGMLKVHAFVSELDPFVTLFGIVGAKE